MIHYPHFALPNVYLLNGYREVRTRHGIGREYEREEELEQCVQRVLLRQHERFRGWDLRFLRRGLGFSQLELGQLVDRDAQTVARWEKTSDAIPAFADLAIRVRFAERFEPWMTVQEVLTYVDGTARPLPETIVLKLTNAGWTFDFDPRIKFPHTTSRTFGAIYVSTKVSPFVRIYEHYGATLRDATIRSGKPTAEEFTGLRDLSSYSRLFLPSSLTRMVAIEGVSVLGLTGSQGTSDDSIITRH